MTMKKTDKSGSVGVPRWLSAADAAVLVVIAAVAAVRAMFTETPHIEPMGRGMPLSNEAISLLLSSVLLAMPVVWLVLRGAAGRLCWRQIGWTIAAAAFCAAGLVGAAFASDQRAALTDIATLASGLAAGVVAVQLLDSREKIRLLLWLLLAVGAAAAYACYEKMAESNEQLIAEYEKNPDAMLRQFGIERGSLEQWQYEHRLHSKDVSGFLTTSNSAGSFFLLAVFAGVGLCIEAYRARGHEETRVALVCTGLVTAVSLAGLLMTQSKGAIGAFVLIIPLLAVCTLWGKTLWKYRVILTITAAVCAVAAVAAMIAYGQRHGRLPGGNSMLVRWQYWTASTRMAADYPLLGVGGGNFAAHYMRYKNPAAPETVADPHNWLLSILCRFGVLGLAFFTATMAIAIRGQKTEDRGQMAEGWKERFLWAGLLADVLAALLAMRPVVMQLTAYAGSSQEWGAAYLLLIVIPAGIVAMVFVLLRFAAKGDASLHRDNKKLTLAITCGLAAVLLHNLVDFALFEPGVWTWFWLLAAAGLSLAKYPCPAAISVNPKRRWLVPTAAITTYVIYIVVFVVPPVRRGALVAAAVRQPPQQATATLQRAVAVDTLSSDAAFFAGRLMLYYGGKMSQTVDMEMIRDAEAFAKTAVARSRRDPRCRQLLADVLLTAAQHTNDTTAKLALRQAAYAALQEALQLYPGSDVMHYTAGVLAEELGQTEAALAYLKTALEIETAYRQQFKTMYPTQNEVISRLGPTNYQDLLERIKRLEPQTPCPALPTIN